MCGALFCLKKNIKFSHFHSQISQFSVFNGFKALVSINIAQNVVRNIPEGAFAVLNSSEHVKLSGNSIYQLAANVPNVQLEVLDLI